jgi:hypothetical protein
MAEGEITHNKLSGSTDGEWVKVTGTAAGSAVTAHTAGAGTTNRTYVTLYAYNVHTASVSLYVQKGSGDYVELTLGSKRGLTLIMDQAPIMNSKTIKAYASVADVVYLDGRVKTVEGSS